MTGPPLGPRARIEPLDPARHDRSVFCCGVGQVDNFFRRTAGKLVRAGNLRVYVMTSGDGPPVGFYALNAHSVDFSELPPRYAHNRPRHGSIPAAYISMIGVDMRFQGKGYGGDLLVDALRRIARAAQSLGIAVAMLDVLDCGDADRTEQRAALYRSYGFTPLPSRQLRMFMPVAAIRTLIERDGA